MLSLFNVPIILHSDWISLLHSFSSVAPKDINLSFKWSWNCWAWITRQIHQNSCKASVFDTFMVIVDCQCVQMTNAQYIIVQNKNIKLYNWAPDFYALLKLLHPKSVIPHLLYLCSDVKAEISSAVGGGTAVGSMASQNRSEDEELTGMKDVKRTAAQAFSGGGMVPKRRSSSRYVTLCFCCVSQYKY